MRFVLAVAVLVVGCVGGSGSSPDAPPPFVPDAAVPPVPSGCITDVSPGDHVYTCGGISVDVRIPAACEMAGCGLILELHGDTGTGLLMDTHVKLRELGEQHGYIVAAPTGPPYGQGELGSTWHESNDATLLDIVGQLRDVFRVDPLKIHLTGFSRGGFATWRLLCDSASLWASVAPAGAGTGAAFGERTCFEQGHAPERPIPILFLMGRTDVSVGYPQLQAMRDNALAAYHLNTTTPVTVAGDASFTHQRWQGGPLLIETFDHAYETVSDGPWASARGHCIPGSTMDPYAPQYAIPCKGPNAFVWGEEVMKFFLEHPQILPD